MADKKRSKAETSVVKVLENSLTLPGIQPITGEIDFTGVRYASMMNGSGYMDRKKITEYSRSVNPQPDGSIIVASGDESAVVKIPRDTVKKYTLDQVIGFGFDEHADKLLTMINTAYTQSGIDRNWTEMPELSISPETYLSVQGRSVTPKTLKDARREMNHAADVLANQSYAIKKGNNIERYVGMFEYIDPITRSNPQLHFKMTKTWYDMICRSRIIYNIGILSLTGNPYRIAWTMAHHYAIDNNRAGGNASYRRLKVSTILKWAPDIPTYDDIQSIPNAAGQWKQRIRKPFENALDAADKAGVLHWEYCGPKGVPLSDDLHELEKYGTWSECYVQFDFVDYPDQEPRLKAKAVEKAKAKTEAEKRAANAERNRRYRERQKQKKMAEKK